MYLNVEPHRLPRTAGEVKSAWQLAEVRAAVRAQRLERRRAQRGRLLAAVTGRRSEAA